LQVIKGKKLTIRWGKSQAKQTATITSAEGGVPAIPGLPGALPLPPQAGEVLRNDFFNLAPPNHSGNFFLPPPGMGGPPPGMMMPGAPIHYPSQDPSRMGAMQPHGH
jgi:pre-mRNA-splicing factor RBM22/SLT11